MADDNELQSPPGLIGEIAQYFFDQAPRPVRKIAIAGSLAFVGGIVGRQFNVSGTGLNNYVMLIAPTGTGKEAVNSGISKLVSACELTVPRLRDHIGPGEFRSDAALLKQFGASKCFVSVFGEVGMLLKRMSGPRANPNDVGIMRVWLDLWAKSGHGNMLNPMVYSDQTKSTPAVASPAFSIFGESTPERFFEVLDETMVADGLLPRFTIIEYHGDRPDLNEGAASVKPSQKLIAHIGSIVAEVNSLAAGNQVVNVGFTPEAAKLVSEFNDYCDSNIRGSREVSRHIFNRAHLKAMKLAAVVAVGIDFKNPIIDLDCAKWATDVVYRDATNLLGRFERGEVGDVAGNELLQQDRILTVMRECIERPFEQVKGQYGGTIEMHKMGLVTHQYLQRRLLNLPLFKGEGPGKATPALKRAIESLGENAKIEVLSAMRANALFGHSFRSYRLAEYNPKNEVENHKKFNFFGDDVGDVVKANMK